MFQNSRYSIVVNIADVYKRQHQHRHHVAEHRGQFTCGHGANDDELGAKPGNRDDTAINGQHHSGVIKG